MIAMAPAWALLSRSLSGVPLRWLTRPSPALRVLPYAPSFSASARRATGRVRPRLLPSGFRRRNGPLEWLFSMEGPRWVRSSRLCWLVDSWILWLAGEFLSSSLERLALSGLPPGLRCIDRSRIVLACQNRSESTSWRGNRRSFRAPLLRSPLCWLFDRHGAFCSRVFWLILSGGSTCFGCLLI